jgi:hypothetical protein
VPTEAQEVLELCALILGGVEDAIHYRVLAAAIQESGAYDLADTYKRPADSIYSLMIADIRRGGRRFAFHGNGVFSAFGHTPSPVEAKVAVESAKTPRERTPLAMVANATCGDCANFAYSGVQIIQRTMGSCASTESGRHYVRPGDQSCHMWRKKNREMLEKEHVERLKTAALIDEINKVVHEGNKKRERASSGNYHGR